MILTGRQSIGGGSMATQHHHLAQCDGKPNTWQPRSRILSDELAGLFALWPASAGRITRVLYSPPDWDDRPRAVAIPGRSPVKTGNFPHDDTHQLILTTLDGRRHTVTVTPPETSGRSGSLVSVAEP